MLLLFSGLLIYSQTAAAAWDEAFHLLAAQLIKSGKRPYLDFFFPQTPLNAYWVAGWMRLFGESWRMVHALSAALTAGAVLLTADFVLRRMPPPAWHIGAAIAAAVATGLNVMVFQFGAVGQAYGLCLFLMVASFRLSIPAVDRPTALWPALAGFTAGAAAASSLLTAPVGPVLLIWILIHSRTGSRSIKFAAFFAGAIVAFLPLLRLLIAAPHRVIFNIFNYHFFYRQVEWEGAIQHDLEVLTSWIDSWQALLLGLLAIAGLLFVARRSQWDRSRRAELYLCVCLVLALSVHISIAHPTFTRYFLFTAPFFAILAAVGLYSVASRLCAPNRIWPPVAILAILFSLALGKTLYERRTNMTWSDLEGVARKVAEVTQPQQTLLADEFVYFLTRRVPPSGMELADSHKLELPAGLAASLHVLPGSELDKQVRAGRFSTVETCDDDDERVEALHLRELYSKRAEVSGCVVYWEWARKNLSRMNRSQ